MVSFPDLPSLYTEHGNVPQLQEFVLLKFRFLDVMLEITELILKTCPHHHYLKDKASIVLNRVLRCPIDRNDDNDVSLISQPTYPQISDPNSGHSDPGPISTTVYGV
ncbi:hypothetical protein Sjap_022074 [Stephania japonica]|uniref:Uncharacterized protein n=1 Tax=Stephania japonica TaxID=461633 RepID=A0AAP0ERB0_9MAGN